MLHLWTPSFCALSDRPLQHYQGHLKGQAEMLFWFGFVWRFALQRAEKDVFS